MIWKLAAPTSPKVVTIGHRTTIGDDPASINYGRAINTLVASYAVPAMLSVNHDARTTIKKLFTVAFFLNLGFAPVYFNLDQDVLFFKGMIGLQLFFSRSLLYPFYGQTPRFVASDVAPFAFNNNSNHFADYFAVLAQVELVVFRTWRTAHHLYLGTGVTETRFYLDYSAGATVTYNNFRKPARVLKHEAKILSSRQFGTFLRKLGPKVSETLNTQKFFPNFRRVLEIRSRRLLLRRA